MDKTITHLPTELIERILLQVSDINSLLSLAYSSSVIYQVYLMSLEKLHMGLLDKKYEEISLDINEAIAAIRSTGLGLKNNKEEAIAVLDDWRRRKETAKRVRQSLSMEEIIELDKFHKEILFLLNHFQNNAALPDWLIDRTDYNPLPLRLTNSERRRFVTALCRFVIHANIFGRNREANGFVPSTDDNNWEEETSAEDAWRLFFGTMPPWEYDEIGCVSWHITHSWYALLDEEAAKENDTISDWERYIPGHYLEESGYSDSLRNVDGRPFMQLTLEEKTDDWALASARIVGDTSIGFDQDLYEGGYYATFGPRFLFRMMHADTLVRYKTLLANINNRVRFDSWIGLRAKMPRNRRLSLLYPAEKYNVESFEDLWSKTSDMEGPAALWRRVTQDLFTKHRDFKAAFVKERIDIDLHNPEEGWYWQADIWDEDRLEE